MQLRGAYLFLAFLSVPVWGEEIPDAYCGRWLRHAAADRERAELTSPGDAVAMLAQWRDDFRDAEPALPSDMLPEVAYGTEGALLGRVIRGRDRKRVAERMARLSRRLATAPETVVVFHAPNAATAAQLIASAVGSDRNVMNGEVTNSYFMLPRVMGVLGIFLQASAGVWPRPDVAGWFGLGVTAAAVTAEIGLTQLEHRVNVNRARDHLYWAWTRLPKKHMRQTYLGTNFDGVGRMDWLVETGPLAEASVFWWVDDGH